MELVRHIAAAEMRFLETTINAEFPSSAGLPDAIKTPAEVAAWYSENFTRNFDKLTQLKGDHLMKITDFRGLFKLPAVAFPPTRHEPQHSQSRPTLRLPALHGRQSPLDLRRKLRRRPSSQSRRPSLSNSAG